MGKSPDIPEPPDPQEVAGAQAQANTGSAVASALLNLIDTQSPLGSVTFERIGGGQQQPTPPQFGGVPGFGGRPGFGGGFLGQGGGIGLPSAQGSPTFGNRGGIGGQGIDSGTIRVQVGDETVEVPRFRRVVELAPEAQQQLEQQQQLGSELSDLALFNVGRVRDVQNQPFDPDVPPIQSQIGSDREIPSAQQRTDLSRQGLPDIPGPGQFGDEAQRLERAIFNRQRSLLEPEFQQRRQEQDVRLTNRGLPIGSEPRNRVERNLARTENRALQEAANQAVGQGFDLQNQLFGQALAGRGQLFGERAQEFNAENQALSNLFTQGLSAQQQDFAQSAQQASLQNQARQQGFQEQAFQRSLPINEIAALLGTSPGVQAPQGISPAQVGVNAPDVAGAIFGANQFQQNAALANQQANTSLINSLIGAGGQIGKAAIASDERIKADIENEGSIGDIPLKSFRFIGSDERHIGVMAQDVEKVLPTAVIDGPIKMVDYGMIYGHKSR